MVTEEEAWKFYFELINIKIIIIIAKETCVSNLERSRKTKTYLDQVI